jgi:hypothetical protein
MRITTILACTLLALVVAACSGVHVQSTAIDSFAAGNYHYYAWRTEPLPQEARTADALYTIDPVLRQTVDAILHSRGYVLDPQRAQFTVDYLYVTEMVQGERSELASNISHIPRIMPNRQVDQASVDNAIALGGVKETKNIVLQFRDRGTNREVWQVIMTIIVEDNNSTDTSRLDDNLENLLARALRPLPPAGHQ